MAAISSVVKTHNKNESMVVSFVSDVSYLLLLIVSDDEYLTTKHWHLRQRICVQIGGVMHD